MAKFSIQSAKTSQSVNIFIQDSSKSTGVGLAALVFNSAGLTAYYTFTGANATSTQITLATLAAVNSAYSSGGFKEIDATNMPGIYRLDLPNAVIAAAKGQTVAVYLQGATNMAPCVLEIEMTGWDNQDATRGGMTALPNANAAAANGLLVLGTNATAISFTAGMTISNTTGDALALTSSGSNGNAINASANGTGTAFKMTGGATGNAMTLIGGATSGDGMNVTTTSGHGLNIVATGTAKDGIHATGAAAATTNAAGHGMNLTGGAASTGAGGTSGVGLKSTGGAGAASNNGSGEGMTLSGGGTTTVAGANGLSSTGTGNLNGVSWVGAGSGAGELTTGGTTGSAVKWVGGATSGDGLTLTTTSGHGFNIAATGSSKHGITSTGGNAGTSDGIKGVAGTGGVDIRGNLTGNITGNLSGSANSVTTAVTIGTINSSASNIKKNTALSGFQFVMTNSSTHSPQTGLTVTGTVSLDGGAFGALTNSVTEIANGWYKINLAAADLNGNTVALKFSATGGDDRDLTLITQP